MRHSALQKFVSHVHCAKDKLDAESQYSMWNSVAVEMIRTETSMLLHISIGQAVRTHV